MPGELRTEGLWQKMTKCTPCSIISVLLPLGCLSGVAGGKESEGEGVKGQMEQVSAYNQGRRELKSGCGHQSGSKGLFEEISSV